MMETLHGDIFNIRSVNDFNVKAIEIFQWQYENNPLYRQFTDLLGIIPDQVSEFHEIPFLPAEFFRTNKILSGVTGYQSVFRSSGTTGGPVSSHYVHDLALYGNSLASCFSRFFGDPAGYCFLALLPSYLENKNSSLVFMVNRLMEQSGCEFNGFYLNDFCRLHDQLVKMQETGAKVILFGVSFALLDFSESHPLCFPELTIIETGGMKGRKEEIVREELHSRLKKAFEVPSVCSEYGMTELLSQAYSMGNGIFRSPPWMKVLIADMQDPLSFVDTGKSGIINIIDLANLYSCSFIATKDIGRMHEDGSFEVLGRLDNSEIRGCSLLYT